MADQYCQELLKISIAQICQGLGWHAIQSTPCDLLNDILQRYIEHIAVYTHRYAEQYGRTEPNLDDIALAFSDMQVRLGEFEGYLRDVDPVPFVHALPKFPVAKRTNLQHPRPGSRDCRERLWYIPAHMPPLVGVSRDLAEVVDPIDPGGASSYSYMDTNESSMDTSYTDFTPGYATPRSGPEKRSDVNNPYSEQTMKRLRLANDGTPQELTAVFMGVNGELTPKREGKLPDATTPPQRDWRRSSLPQSPLARKGVEGHGGDMPHGRTQDSVTPPLIRPPKSPKPGMMMSTPISPKGKALPPPKPKPKSPKHLLFSPHAPVKFQVKPKTPTPGATPDISRPEQVPSPSPKSPKGSYLSSILSASKKHPETSKVAQETPTKAPILSSLMKKKETAVKDTALAVYDFEDEFDFGAAPTKDRPHAAMDSFASSKVASSKPLTELKQENVDTQFSTSDSIDATIEAVIAGKTIVPLGSADAGGKSKKHKESRDKSGDREKKEKNKDKHKDKHRDKDRSKDGKEKSRDEKKDATVLIGSSPYSFEDSFSAAIKKRDDAQKTSKGGHSLPPKLFLKNAWREGEGAVTSSIRIGTEPGQAPKLVIKTKSENPAGGVGREKGKSAADSTVGKKLGLKLKEKMKLKIKKKEKLKLKKKKEKLMKKKLEKKKMLLAKPQKLLAPSLDDSSASLKKKEAKEPIPKMNIIGKSGDLKIQLSSSPQVTPEHKGSAREDKGEKSKDKSKKKKKDKDKGKEKDKKEKKKKEGRKEEKRSESKKEEKDKKVKGDSSVASSPAPSQPAIPKITFKFGAKISAGEKRQTVVIKPSASPVRPSSPVSSLSPPSSPSPVRSKPAPKTTAKQSSKAPKSPVRSPKSSPSPPMLPITAPPMRKASLAASKAVSAMSSPRSKGASPPQKSPPEKQKGGAKASVNTSPATKTATPKAASPKPATVPTKAALAVGKGPPVTPTPASTSASKAAAASAAAAAAAAKEKEKEAARTVITETIGTVVSDTGEKIWICPACKLPDDGSPMVGCDTCDDWYHWPCVDITEEPDEENWYCSKCIKPKPKTKKKKKKHRD